MPSPFPGMNPYLESPQFWSEVHHRLITALADAIETELSLKYRVAIEKRTYLNNSDESVEVGIPDVAVTFQKSTLTSQTPATATLPTLGEAVTVTIPVPEEIREGYLEIREAATGYVMTTIEVLSPTNKRAGTGREAYLRKRQEVLSTPTHLVEIDLLRGGKPMPILSEIPQTDYRILIALGNRRPLAQFYGFSVRQEIPKFFLPLQSGDTEPIVDLQSLLVGIYQRARYDMAVDYSQEPVPRLKEEDRVWADELLREKGRR
ncbi:MULTISPECIES: DUF4058 family protein [unclassified Coleofasciculus]|uniref:DUF4058 family protein n=1 Tax=unclassified Coleofasciculus TaxID=2692782 RepID=UPI0018829710|nr:MULTISPECIES: DUF4058 family protein [unclassified Coleofasciculus]MBE9129617.1 DUF4058 family protein [Coleofasciculus sp. LEGE 07081]MBE9152151.1 DUF4058 family protein [Coleofasciculus sp. LEGE 07092]